MRVLSSALMVASVGIVQRKEIYNALADADRSLTALYGGQIGRAHV